MGSSQYLFYLEGTCACSTNDVAPVLNFWWPKKRRQMQQLFLLILNVCVINATNLHVVFIFHPIWLCLINEIQLILIIFCTRLKLH